MACGGDEETQAPTVSIQNNGPNPCFPQLVAIINVDSLQSPIVATIWNGPEDFTSDQLSVEAKIPGTYTITVTDETGESTMESTTISESDIMSTPPTVTIEDQGLNTDLELVLEALGTAGSGDINSYTWSAMNATVNTTSTLAVDEVGVYTVTIEDECGQTATAFQEVTELDLSPYEDEWSVLAWNATVTISVGNVTSESTITGANLNYNLRLEFPNWKTEGEYDAIFETDSQNFTEEVRGIAGKGTYVIEDDVLTSDGSFFEYESGMQTTSSEMWSADLSINPDGQLVVSEKRTEEGVSNGSDVVVIIKSTSIWERK